MTKEYTSLKKLTSEKGEIELEAEVSQETLAEHVAEALAHMSANFTLPGFRKGRVPEHLVRERVSEMELLESAADVAIRKAIQAIETDQGLMVLGVPQVTVTKIAPKNPLGFKVRFALFPHITLPDYKKIGRTITEREDEMEVPDKELQEAINRILTMFTPPDQQNDPAKKPELTDEFVKQLGAFTTVADFRTELTKQMAREKEMGMKDAKRAEIVKEIVAKSKFDLPQMLIAQELHRFTENRDKELQAAGLSMDDYLKQSGKTAEELKKEEQGVIEEQLKVSFVLREIRTKENITASEREVQTKIEHLKLRNPKRTNDSLRHTAEATVIQEKLFAVLEGMPKNTQN